MVPKVELMDFGTFRMDYPDIRIDCNVKVNSRISRSDLAFRMSLFLSVESCLTDHYNSEKWRWRHFSLDKLHEFRFMQRGFPDDLPGQPGMQMLQRPVREWSDLPQLVEERQAGSANRQT